jgi:hypothetical protein
MKTKNLGWGQITPIRRHARGFGPLHEKIQGGRTLAAFSQAAERARIGTQGTGCIKFSSSGLALPCNESEKKFRS